MPQSKAAYEEAQTGLMASGAPFETESRTINGIGYTVYKNAPANLREAYAPAAAHGDTEFIVYEGERFTFAQTLQQANEIGTALLAAGVCKGERVAIAMRNFPEWITAYVGITSIGAVVVPVNSWGTPDELLFAVGDCGAKFVFCDEQRYAGLEGSEAQRILVRGEHGNEQDSLDEFLSDVRGATMPEVNLDGEDLAMIMYTSGTTGVPKGAASTHRAICQAIFNFEFMGAAMAMCNMDKITAMLEKGHPPSSLLAVPLFHVSGCHAQLLLNLRGGRRIVIMYKWDADRALSYIEEERITTVSAAPSMMMDLLEHPRFDTTDTSSLFALGTGGAATPNRVTAQLNTKVPNHFTGTGYGLTETNAQGTSVTGAGFMANTGSAGYITPIVELEIRDAAGNALPAGEDGTIWIKSPSNIREYWNRPDANAKDFHDGWFDTGDIGHLDKHGYLYLSDRAKDMVIRGGENIYPLEIENVLFDHSAVHEVAAFGLPHDKLGEELACAIVLESGHDATEDEVRQFARKRLAGFKVPSKVFIRSEPLPRNASNKVLKAALKDQYGH